MTVRTSRTTPRALNVALLIVLAQGLAAAEKERGQKPDVEPVSGRAPARGTIKASVEHPIYVSAQELKWTDGPPALPPGAKMAVLDGDPSVSDRLFGLRLMLPANYRVMPHWHPADEHVTVVSGEVRIGDGDAFAPDQARTITTGGYFVMPARHHHFAMTTRETVIQLHGVGPWKIIYVNPADDPRQQRQQPPR